ncbi:MAG TPA: DUF2911 domain-containing protein [Gemmatimonadales bacterium]|nr:DUF2911 domain-containing protein [Gemmatimonadales bacterium]
MRQLLAASTVALCLGACAPSDEPASAAGSTDTSAAAGPSGERPASPRDTARGTIGSATLLVDYGRPSRRGREIFGSLVPFDQVWRTGANAATTLVVGAPVQIAGQPLAAGTYTLYSLPARDGWTLIVNGQTGQWGTEYVGVRDVLRVPMSVSPIEPVDTFTITVAGGADEGQLVFAWDTLQGTVPVRAR